MAKVVETTYNKKTIIQPLNSLSISHSLYWHVDSLSSNIYTFNPIYDGPKDKVHDKLNLAKDKGPSILYYLLFDFASLLKN